MTLKFQFRNLNTSRNIFNFKLHERMVMVQKIIVCLQLNYKFNYSCKTIVFIFVHELIFIKSVYYLSICLIVLAEFVDNLLVI